MMKRKLLSVLVTVCMVLALLPAAGLTASADYTASYTMTALHDGDKTLSDGDIVSISTAEELGYLSSVLTSDNGYGAGVVFYLTQDITLNDWTDGNSNEIVDSGELTHADSSAQSWTMIDYFAGTLDGNGHTIYGLYINATSGYTAFIDNLRDGACIQNLSFSNGYVKVAYYSSLMAARVPSDATVSIYNCSNSCTLLSSGSYSGGLIGRVSGTVSMTSCCNTAPLTLGGFSGGLIGDVLAAGTVNMTDCYNTAPIEFKRGGFYQGGLVGQNLGTVIMTDCYNTGDIDYNGGGQRGGGLVGGNGGTVDMTGCYNAGTLNNIGITLGGLVGMTGAATLTNCYNTGTLNGSSTIGGLIGQVEESCSLSYCYNTGMLNGSSSGGLIGYVKKSCSLSYCYNTGMVNGIQSGGLISIVSSSCTSSDVAYCYNAGRLVGTNCGNLIYYNDCPSATYTNCYYDKQISTGSGEIANVEGKITSDMLGEGLDTGAAGDGWTDEHWVFSNGGYPRLAGMAETDAAYISAAPLMLSYTSPSDYETANTVASSVTVGTNNGVTWYDNNGAQITDSSTLTVTTDGITITARLNDISKEVLLKAESSVTVPAAPPSSEAELLSVWTRADTETSGTGASTADPILWDVGEVDATALSLTDITTSDDATVKLYSDSAFSAEITGPDTLAIPMGETTTAYIKVTAQDGNNTVYYAVSFTRALVIWDGTTSAFSGGTGTSTDPYQIGSGAELAYLAQLVNAGTADTNNGSALYASLYYELTDDIHLNTDASDYETWGTSAPSNVWMPMGNDSNSFTGTFNGNDYAVSGIYINSTDNYQGLFGYVDGGTMESINVTDSYICGGSDVGGIAGRISSGTITDCSNAASVSAIYDNIGGIAGYSEATIERCYNTGKISGRDYAGGIAGYGDGGTISKCYNSCSISGGSSVGGIVGEFVNNGTISYCYNAGSIFSTSDGCYVGGVIGYRYSTNTAENCYNTGRISSGNTVGGVCGDSNGSALTNFYYDKQVCPLDNGVGDDDTTGDMGRLTAQMTGTNMFNDAACWTTDGGLYPRLKDMDTTAAAYISAAAAALYANGTAYETVNSVSHDIDVSTANGVTWSSSAACISVDNNAGKANIQSDGTDVTLTASLGGASKTITISQVTKLSSDAGLISVLSETITAGSEAGTSAVPKTASVSLSSSVTEVSATDLVAAENATVTFYGTDSGFNTEETGSVSLAPDSTKTVYIKVVAEDDTTVYYAVAITTPSASSGDASGGYTGGNTGGNSDGDSSNGGADVIVNGEKHSAGKAETTTENGRTQTTVTVDSDKLQELLESEGDGATVTIPIAGGANTSSGVLTGQMVKNMADKDATLVVETGSSTYTLPAEQIDIDDVAQQFGEDIDLSDIEVAVTISEPSDSTVQVVENAAEEGGFSLVVQAVEFTVECTYNGRTTEVTTYNAYVERTIEIPDGVDPDEITTAVVVDPDGSVRHVPTEIVEIDGKYYAVINSLTNSVYTLIYNPVAFADMKDHWAQDAVNDMASRKVINGYEDGTFRPEGAITRAELAAMLVRALGLPEGMGENTFSDVDADDWHCGYVETAAAYGIINGFVDGTFRPQDNITCEQAMTMTARAMALTKLDYTLTQAEIEQLLAGYSDMADASEYARESIAACLKTGVVADSDDYKLVAKEYITRAEVAMLTQNLLVQSDLI